MLARMQLFLPRDARYLPVLRNLADCMLSNFTVPDDAMQDIKVAMTEACGNAVRHADGVAEYAVFLQVSESACEVEVVDGGPGFPSDQDSPSEAAATAADSEREGGRGLHLMRALVDESSFDSVENATYVRLVKRWSVVGPRGPAGSVAMTAP